MRNDRAMFPCFHVVVKYSEGGSLKLYDTWIQLVFSFKVFPSLLFPFYRASDFAKSYHSAQLHIWNYVERTH